MIRPLDIAFYAPLKSPDHPVPSGDRLMARQLMEALRRAGHRVELASTLRAYLPSPEDVAAYKSLQADAANEALRIQGQWARRGAPDLWFCYHPYCKSPDLIGPSLWRAAGLPNVTAEASWSARRDRGVWADTQDRLLESLQRAAVNISLTRRDRDGILEALPGARAVLMRPFIDPLPFSVPATRPQSLRITTVAMMRAGDKLDSYRVLASALHLLPEKLDWRLSVVGDGPERAAVRALFANLPLRRIHWHGEQDAQGVAAILSSAAVFAWPGCGEAYGLAYLEAQAAGVPVVAFATAGVPEVVADGQTGLLTPPGDAAAFAEALAGLLTDAPRRAAMAAAARERVARLHSLDAATAELAQVLDRAVAAGRKTNSR